VRAARPAARHISELLARSGDKIVLQGTLAHKYNFAAVRVTVRCRCGCRAGCRCAGASAGRAREQRGGGAQWLAPEVLQGEDYGMVGPATPTRRAPRTRSPA
jgi:hypothetical protein